MSNHLATEKEKTTQDMQLLLEKLIETTQIALKEGYEKGKRESSEQQTEVDNVNAKTTADSVIELITIIKSVSVSEKVEAYKKGYLQGCIEMKEVYKKV